MSEDVPVPTEGGARPAASPVARERAWKGIQKGGFGFGLGLGFDFVTKTHHFWHLPIPKLFAHGDTYANLPYRSQGFIPKEIGEEYGLAQNMFATISGKQKVVGAYRNSKVLQPLAKEWA